MSNRFSVKGGVNEEDFFQSERLSSKLRYSFVPWSWAKRMGSGWDGRVLCALWRGWLVHGRQPFFVNNQWLNDLGISRRYWNDQLRRHKDSGVIRLHGGTHGEYLRVEIVED